MSKFLWLRKKITAAALLMASMAQEKGLFKEQYNKFIILTAGRTGSTMLADCLAQHPAVEMYYEVFHNKAEQGSARWRAMLLNDPVRYLRLRVFRYYPPRVKVVGFSMHYYHCQEGAQKKAWDYLATSDVRVLHLKRNPFASYVSGQLVRKFRIAHVRDRDDLKYMENASIRLDTQGCQAYFDEYQQNLKIYTSLFQSHDQLEVWYERLTDTFEVEIRRIQEWLGLEPILPVPRSYKQVSRPLWEVVENYNELRLYFQDSPYYQYFDALPAAS